MMPQHTRRHPYATLEYARTLANAGTPLDIQEWQCPVMVRPWGDEYRDAIGPYPLACLSPDSDLFGGLQRLRVAGLLTATLVVDGLVGPPLATLRESFDVAGAYKTHYLMDPAVGPYRPTPHHAHEIKRAIKRGVEVRFVDLHDIIEAWCGLYEQLQSRHDIAGAQRFSHESFRQLADCQGLHTVGAYWNDLLVSCHLWFEHEGRVWSHLAASNDDGYANGAAYAIYDVALQHFSRQLVNLGGAAGIERDSSDGLARFKAGFSNRTTIAHIFGSVLNPSVYAVLTQPTLSSGGYFPAYRSPRVAGAPT